MTIYNVIVADDNKPLRMGVQDVVARYFSGSTFSMKGCSSGRDLLKQALGEQNRPDLFIVSFYLAPDNCGESTVKFMRDVLQVEAPIILYGPYEDLGSRHDDLSSEIGASSFLVLPEEDSGLPGFYSELEQTIMPYLPKIK